MLSHGTYYLIKFQKEYNEAKPDTNEQKKTEELTEWNTIWQG